MSNKIKTLVFALGIAGFGLVQAAPSNPPAAAHAKQEAGQGYHKKASTSFQMTVKAIDTKQRLLTLTSKSGDEIVLHAGKDVKYFSQAKVGDVITTTVTDSIAFTPATGNNRMVIENQTIAKSRPGTAPEAIYTTTSTTTVKVIKVSAKQNMITIQNPKGDQEKLKVKDPELQARLKNVKPGDNIQITLAHVISIKAPMHTKQQLPSKQR